MFHKKVLISTLFLVFLLISLPGKVTLKKTLVIGSNSRDYTFFRITGAVISPDKQIYIGDGGGKFIAKYDWNGNFIKRAGQDGQGKGDFQTIKSLKYYKDTLFINDIRNRRIARYDDELKVKRYILNTISVTEDLDIMEGGDFLVSVRDINLSNGKGYIGIFNPKEGKNSFFFNRNQFGEYSKKGTKKGDLKWALNMLTSKVLFSYSYTKSEILVGFEYPGLPAEFWVFTEKGVELKKFQLPFEAGYEFPYFFQSYPFKKVEEVKYISVSSILSYKNCWLVSILHNLRRGTKSKIFKKELMVFNSDGKFIGRLDTAINTRFFNITEDGYLIGADNYGDIPVVLIFKCSVKEA